jgi:hypothetical protein
MRKIGGLTTSRKQTPGTDPLAPFSAPVRRWFEASFEGPTPAQTGGWEAISSGAHTLICAPTGSGKTLASFLWGIDRLSRAGDQPPGVKLVYVSPLKALSYDIERNLRAPLRGIGADISVGLRTGDTPQSERRAMKKTPPEILITTPESLYLMLSSSVREIFSTVDTVIVDEIHAVAQSKRGSHLALSLEQLGIDRRPDRADVGERLPLGRHSLRVGEVRSSRLGHVVDRYDDLQVQLLRDPRIHDLALPFGAHQKLRNPLQRPLCRREPDPLDPGVGGGGGGGRPPPPFPGGGRTGGGQHAASDRAARGDGE